MRTIVLSPALALALLPAAVLLAQTAPTPLSLFAAASLSPFGSYAPLPDAPSSSVFRLPDAIILSAVPPCPSDAAIAGDFLTPESEAQSSTPCIVQPNPYRRFLDTNAPLPLTPRQKARLALHNLTDPGNLVTIFGTSAFTIGMDSHTAYGPGWHGFRRNAGVSLLQDTTGEFFGVFLIPSLTQEDPHYHRMPHAGIPRRILHAVSRTVLSQHDDGSPMLNFATLLTYPISAEISNLYVPGIRDNGPSTVARILTGYATDPVDNLITEFLPDVARHIHVQVIFVQRILNQVAADQYALP